MKTTLISGDQYIDEALKYSIDSLEELDDKLKRRMSDPDRWTESHLADTAKLSFEIRALLPKLRSML